MEFLNPVACHSVLYLAEVVLGNNGKCSGQRNANSFQVTRRFYSPLPQTSTSLRLHSDTTGLEEQERERRRQVMEKFQKAPFEEIAAHCESKVQREPIGPLVLVFTSVTVDVFHPQANMLHDRLAQIFELTIR